MTLVLVGRGRSAPGTGFGHRGVPVLGAVHRGDHDCPGDGSARSVDVVGEGEVEQLVTTGRVAGGVALAVVGTVVCYPHGVRRDPRGDRGGRLLVDVTLHAVVAAAEL